MCARYIRFDSSSGTVHLTHVLLPPLPFPSLTLSLSDCPMPVKKGRYLETRVIEQMIRYCDPIGPWRLTRGEASKIISGKGDEKFTPSTVLPTISTWFV